MPTVDDLVQSTTKRWITQLSDLRAADEYLRVAELARRPPSLTAAEAE